MRQRDIIAQISVSLPQLFFLTALSLCLITRDRLSCEMLIRLNCKINCEIQEPSQSSRFNPILGGKKKEHVYLISYATVCCSHKQHCRLTNTSGRWEEWLTTGALHLLKKKKKKRHSPCLLLKWSRCLLCWCSFLRWLEDLGKQRRCNVITYEFIIL